MTVHFGLIGQTSLTSETEIIPCATVEQDSLTRMKYPQLGTIDDFEEILQLKIEEIKARHASGRIEATVVTIPIIFHIVHNGEAVGSGTNLSQAQVQSQIDALNEDFRRLPGTLGSSISNGVAADIEIEFCLAYLNEQGQNLDEPGVNRIRGSREEWSRAQIEGELKPSTIWDPNFYYNVWSVNITPGSNSILLGYAQFPSSSTLNGLPEDGGPALTDGVVLSYRVLGADRGGQNFPGLMDNHNLGRTLTHETGHWLGLRHIWGDGPCGSDDFVADTPEQAAETRGCVPQGTQQTCESFDMVENYMDYTDDACMGVFTNGQKARILAVMELSPRRGILTQSQVCGQLVSEPPVANFSADKNFTLLGGTVKFTDLSSNFPNRWHWEFDGGDPAVSTDKNPVITYNSPGIFSVKMASFNDIGSSDTLFFETFIEVSEEGLCNTISNFEGGTPTVLRPDKGTGANGYVAGHNSLKHTGISEYFSNDLGYVELSGALINFGYVNTTNQDAKVKVVVWNALGPQNAPSRIVEEKEILLSQIQEDIDNGRATSVNFDRRVPIFLGTAFHVGLELVHDGDSVAVITTAHGESTKQTSWTRLPDGTWSPYSLFWGVDVAHDITPLVGMKPSVQLAPSDLAIYAGQELTINASGASIFVWNSDDGTVIDHLGPQLKTRPRQKTTYTVQGSGLDLCVEEATFTVYILESPVGIKDEANATVKLYPNPVVDQLNIEMVNDFRGEVCISLYGLNGQIVGQWSYSKLDSKWEAQLKPISISPGIYQLEMVFGEKRVSRKLIFDR